MKTLSLVPAATILLASVCNAALAPDSAAAKTMSLAAAPFMENIGQIPSESVRFSARTFGGSLYVRADGRLVYALPAAAKHGEGNPGSAAAVFEEWVEGGGAMPLGVNRSAVQIASFTGPAEQWRSNIPTYEAVNMGEILPGVELTLRARGANMEKVFLLAPGVDPADIKIQTRGIESLKTDGQGRLVARTASGDVVFTAPSAFQVRGMDRVPLQVAYTVEDTQYGFSVPGRDPALPLVIDPLIHSTYLGGAKDDWLGDMALDVSGNVFVVGHTWSADFAAGAEACMGGWTGGTDVVVARLSSTLAELQCVAYLGGPHNDYGNAIAMFPSENWDVMVVGSSLGGFPMAGDSYNTNYLGDAYARGLGDAFVARLSYNLQTLQASTYIGGKNADSATSVTLADIPATAILVGGYTESTNFPVSAGAYCTNHHATPSHVYYDGFAAKFDLALSNLTASTFLGGTQRDYIRDMAWDPVRRRVYVFGETLSTNFPTTAGAYDTQFATNTAGGANSYETFISALNEHLSSLHASTFLGGEYTDLGAQMIRDSAGSIVVVGDTSSHDFPATPGAYNDGWTVRWSGMRDGFISKLDYNLTNLIASTMLGGSGDDVCNAVALDGNGNILVAGGTGSIYNPTAGLNFPVLPGAYNSTYGTAGAFASKLNPGLTELLSSTFVATAEAIGFSTFNQVVVAGYTSASDLPVTPLAFDPSYNGSNDMFVCVLDEDMTLGTAGIDQPRNVAATDGAYRDRVRVAWTAATNALSYRVWCSTGILPAMAYPIGETLDLEFNDISVLRDVTYYYWVSASNAAGDSAMSGPDPGWLLTALAPPNDYNGDGASEMTIFDNASGGWYALTAGGNVSVWGAAWGWPGARPVPGDYDGDGKSDLAVFDSNSGLWYIAALQETAGSAFVKATTADKSGFGVQERLTPIADRRSLNTEHCTLNTGSPRVIAWGVAWGWPGAWPVSGDYDGDGKSDLAVFDFNTGKWYIAALELACRGSSSRFKVQSSKSETEPPKTDRRTLNTEHCTLNTGSPRVIAWDVAWGWPGAWPVSGDYDCDGKSDLAVFDSNTGKWYIQSVAGAVIAWDTAWGWPGAIPVSGDYDGDGKSDLAVFDSNSGKWYIAALQETAGSAFVKATTADKSGFGVQERLTPNTDHRSPITDHRSPTTGAPRVIAWDVAWGWPGAIPASGDYDGDGNYDLAVFDYNAGKWYIRGVDGTVIVWDTAWGWPGATVVGAAP